ncbi:MAG: thioredoxin family protein [Saprospiraceae bacterium]|nr:thioredoxin family protein [Saprospiraceae bacterium]
MALTESNMLPLGTPAPDFELPDVVSGQLIQLYEQSSKDAYLIMFICNHCPYVVHVMDELVNLTNEYLKKNIAIFAISSNDVSSYPQDGPDRMKELALLKNFSFPYLFDETQEIAKAYDAACTPDFYVFDRNKILKYRGRLDSSRPQSGVPLSGRDLRNALEAVLSDQPVDAEQFPSLGCNIKWKKN